MARKRLDVIMTERGLSASREKAKALIMSGAVYVDGAREDKPGAGYTDSGELRIEIAKEGTRYVSRGGLKLEKALRVFDIELSGAVCMDIGASTGGFTDCMLRSGAARVYSVDVGYGQLDWSLRNDPRVVVMEKTNARYLTPEDIGGEKADFVAADVSFISLEKVIPALIPLLTSEASMVLLVKPQFEAGRGEVGKNGVVRDPSIHEKVLEELISFVLDQGLSVAGIDFSPIKGPKGNIEYLLFLDCQRGEECPRELVQRVVAQAHEELGA